MTDDGHSGSRDELAALLAQYDDALAADKPREAIDTWIARSSRDLGDAGEAAKECLDILHRVRQHGFSLDRDSVTGLINAAEHSATDDPCCGVQLGRFHIERELGHGGLGVVYLAFDTELGRNVALKVPRISALVDQGLRNRFLREAEAAARLAHPNVVRVYETGEEGAVCYLVAEFCDGPNLGQWLRTNKEPVSPRTAATAIRRLALAVQHAHGRGVLHRDIKPSNILLDPTGDEDLPWQPKLTDFGMAKLLECDEAETRTGAMIGTPAYMSPEQAEGRVRDLDARTDVYALGTVLYEMLTGFAPAHGESNVESLRKVLYEEPIATRRVRGDVPPDLEAICMKCLARRRELRYVTAQELADDLLRFLSDQPTEARPVSTVGRIVKWARRRPAVAALVMVCASGTLSLLAISMRYNLRLENALSAARHLLYAADMQTGFEAFQKGNLATLQERLAAHVPLGNAEDQRTFPWRLLDRLCHADQRELYRHDGKVLALARSNDGQLLASAAIDGTIRVWDLIGNHLVVDLTGHTDDVNSLDFSPDGRLLASVADDCSVRIWTLDRSAAPRVLADLGSSSVYGVAFSPDGTLLAVGSEDGKVRLWETSAWSLVKTWSDHQGKVHGVAFFADGSRFVSGSDDGTARIYSVATGNLLATCPPRNNAANRCVAVSHDGLKIATAIWTEKHICIFDARDGEFVADMEAGYVHSLAFSPDGRLLASGQRNGIVRVWNTATWQIAHMLLAHQSDVRDLVFASDGQTLMTAGGDGAVKAWDLRSIEEHDTELLTPTTVTTGVFQPGGKLFAAADEMGGITLMDTELRQSLLRIQPGGPGKFRPMSFSPDGALLAFAASEGRAAEVLNIERRQTWRRLEMPSGQVSALAFAPGGGRLLVATDDSRLTSWDVATGEPVTSCDSGQPEVLQIIYLDRAGYFLTASGKSLVLRSPRTLERQFELPPFTQPLRAVAVSPDESRVIAAAVTGEIPVWDLDKRELITALPVNAGWANGVAFPPDGTSFASCHVDGTLRLWDARTLRNAGTLNMLEYGGSKWVPHVAAFSPHGDTLAVGGSALGGAVRFLSFDSRTTETTDARNGKSDDSWIRIPCLRNGQLTEHIDSRGILEIDSVAPSGESVTVARGSEAVFHDEVAIGHSTHGRLIAEKDSLLCARKKVWIAVRPGSHGELELGKGSQWQNDHHGLYVSRHGRGRLAISEGAVAHSASGLVGDGEGGNGLVTIDGSKSLWHVTLDLQVGVRGNGRVQVSSGGQLTVAEEVQIARRGSSTGFVSIAGADSLLSASALHVGGDGHGRLAIVNRATVHTKACLVGAESAGDGILTIEGNGSTLSCSDFLGIGGHLARRGASGRLVIESGATATVGGLCKVWPKGDLVLRQGTLNVGTLDLCDGRLEYAGGSLLVRGHARLSGKLRLIMDVPDEINNDLRLHIMTYDSHDGTFSTIECPPGMSPEPIYSETGIDVIFRAHPQ